ncbi:ATP-binding cassette domain-containing protein [Pseudactinotalea sp. HY158]|uniref:ABC transporter ATP-binding protein n=1 Tax=unclassified Pseudactinotalea TaxID=2649176 RepID=UPI00129C1301|nr:ATP-binding cassette domain-containing protein [Pseudactinotalea sp. HY158]MPV51217.1 ATP-binding cassette domain-containing protein [Pseudactinotalea sp. HY160]QGH69002.1 ATP-binding cassette domain-containing protein [Pseudactinotalea sp. HY158]
MPEKKKRTAPLIAAHDVLVGYGSTTESAVCPPISVTVRERRSLAIVGANGTGKSTFLRALAGQLAVLAGRIEVFDRAIDERSAEFRRDVAIVLDDDSYLPALTVREHLLLTARGHGVESASALVTELLEDFGLTPRQHALPTALSSGQRRRLLLAAGFVRPRHLLVLDEPEQRLDAGMRDRLTERLAGETAVFATHDPVLVRGAASAALILAEDEVRVVDPETGAAAIEELR